MKQRWDDYEQAADHGPLKFVLKVVGLITIVAAVIGVIGFGFNLIGSTAEVAQEQFGAKAALAKYEWFKNASAQLQKNRPTFRCTKLARNLWLVRTATLRVASGHESTWKRGISMPARLPAQKQATTHWRLSTTLPAPSSTGRSHKATSLKPFNRSRCSDVP